jgi:hypothetical protein
MHTRGSSVRWSNARRAGSGYATTPLSILTPVIFLHLYSSLSSLGCRPLHLTCSEHLLLSLIYCQDLRHHYLHLDIINNAEDLRLQSILHVPETPLTYAQIIMIHGSRKSVPTNSVWDINHGILHHNTCGHQSKHPGRCR